MLARGMELFSRFREVAEMAHFRESPIWLVSPSHDSGVPARGELRDETILIFLSVTAASESVVGDVPARRVKI